MYTEKMNSIKTYDDLFKELFTEIQLVNNDAVEDIQKFKSDFYNLILEKLQIDELYKTHFIKNRKLDENDTKFLKAFFSFITSGSDTKDESKDSNVRGSGKKANRKNGRDILNGNFEMFDEELLSLYQAFYTSLDEEKKENYKLEYNSIYSEAFKRQSNEKLKNTADNLLGRISSLPAPLFSCLIMNLAPDIKQLISNICQILNELEVSQNCNYIGYDENDDPATTIQKIQNIIVNSQLSTLSDSDKSIKRELNATESKAYYRKTKSKINELNTKLNSNIAAENKELLEKVGLPPEKFQYKDNFSTDTKTLYNLANSIYSNITEDMPDIVIKFNKSKK